MRQRRFLETCEPALKSKRAWNLVKLQLAALPGGLNETIDTAILVQHDNQPTT